MARMEQEPDCSRVNYRVRDRDFKYYIFDWDDNILRMPTYIHLERRLGNGTWVPHLVSTALFAVIREDTVHYRPPQNDWSKAFVEFRDFATDDESKFLVDARAAIRRVLDGKEAPPPSFEKFRRALVEARLFAIVTARGHNNETLRKGVEMFIDSILTDHERAEMIRNMRGYIACYNSETQNESMSDRDVRDYYLSLNRYHAVTSRQFEALMKGHLSISDASTEERKQFAILDFIQHIFHIIEEIGGTKPISVGFSDDDAANVRAVTDFIHKELSKHFPSVRFVVYDTSDPGVENGRKVVVSGQLDLGLKME